MKFYPMYSLAVAVLLSAVCPAAPDLSDLLNPDDVMLRKPVTKQADTPVSAAAEKKTETVAEAAAAVEAAEQVRREAEATKAAERAAAEAKARAAAAGEARNEAEAKKTAERVAAEAKARAAAAERAAAEAKARAEAAEQARKESEAKAAAELAALRAQVSTERKTRESIEAQKKAAESRAEAERQAAQKAVEAKAALEKRVDYLQNPDPDERPVEKKPLEAPAVSGPDVTELKSAADVVVTKAGESSPKKKLTGREAVITAERTDYDRKEGVILFDRKVYVDDEQYQMHADRLFVFLDGTNDLKRLVAIGHVSITNEDKTASCTRATYTKATSKIVMYGDDHAKARLREESKKGSTVLGDRITFWLNSEQVEIEGPSVSMPGGALKGADAKSFLKQTK